MFTITRSLQVFTITNLHFLKLWRFNFSNFQTNFVKIFTKKPPGFKKDFESTDKVLRIHQYLWFEISLQWNNWPLTFFGNFGCQILSNEGNIKASVLLILLKYIVVGYSNGNKSFTGRLLSNYGPLNMLFRFFRYLIYSVFQETLVKEFLKKLLFQLKFQKSTSRCSILQKMRMSNFVILKWRPFKYKVKIWKICSFLGLVFQK